MAQSCSWNERLREQSYRIAKEVGLLTFLALLDREQISRIDEVGTLPRPDSACTFGF